MKKISEPEFIVSPAELKRNQKRAMLKEQDLKEEKNDKVKSIIALIIIIGSLIVLAVSINNMTINAIEKCVAGGNSRTFCESELSK